MRKIIQKGADGFRATCHECGCVFVYEFEDVTHNYQLGHECVGCPHCHKPVRHRGAMTAVHKKLLRSSTYGRSRDVP